MNNPNPARINSREDDIRQSAQAALSSIPEGERAAASASRATLLGWLVQMDEDLRSRRGMVTDELVNVAINSLQSVVARCAKQKKKGTEDAKALAAFVEALDGLPDNDVLDCFAFMTKALLDKLGLESRLFTKNLLTDRWEETGFFVDDEVGFAGVSIASTVVHRGGAAEKEEQMPYQPIGYIDENSYLPTESSKLLWARDFAIGAMVPYSRPFKVELRDVMAPFSANAPLSPSQVKGAEELISVLEQDLLQYDAADTPERRAELAEGMRVAIELSTPSLRPLAKLLDTIQADHPEVGTRFENANMRDMVIAINQFLRERIARDVQLHMQASTELKAEPVTPEQVAASMLEAAKAIVTDADAPVDHPRAWSVIAQFKTLYPQDAAAVAQAAEEGKDTKEQLQLVISILESRLT
jgi:hypothetical protein